MSAKNNRIQGPSTSPTCSLLFCRFKKETQMSSDFEQTLFVIPILLQIIGERQATMLQRQMTSFIMGGLMDFCDTGDRFRIVEICHIIFYSAFATLHQWSGSSPYTRSRLKNRRKCPATSEAFSPATNRSLNFALCWVSHIIIKNISCLPFRRLCFTAPKWLYFFWEWTFMNYFAILCGAKHPIGA